MTKDEALKLALDVLEEISDEVFSPYDNKLGGAILAIREALTQLEQEPVACPYCKNWATLGAVFYDQNCVGCVKRMTAPPQPKTPPECVTEAEKKAFAFGWWKAMEAQRLAQPPEERNFCPRCGKRRRGKNDWDVHTCSLPEE